MCNKICCQTRKRAAFMRSRSEAERQAILDEIARIDREHQEALVFSDHNQRVRRLIKSMLVARRQARALLTQHGAHCDCAGCAGCRNERPRLEKGLRFAAAMLTRLMNEMEVYASYLDDERPLRDVELQLMPIVV